MVETVRGPVDAGALGVTLPHEHVFIMRPEALQNFGHVWGSAPYWDEEARHSSIQKVTRMSPVGDRCVTARRP
jgi:phosphotriesterase-related protein